ncbi:MAG: hypothetical protein EF813_10490 [Methanosarcinales archaeon]|nr:MAG: hypothetical protein EF813_10490 [Methanosarcinales archaeon]
MNQHARETTEETTRMTATRSMRIVGLAFVLSLCVIACTPTCAGNVHEATIFYFDGDIRTDRSIDLEQGYMIRVKEVSNDSATIDILNCGKTIKTQDIPQESSYTLEKGLNNINYDIIKISVLGANTTSNTVSLTIEQHIDPDRSFDYPLISDVSANIKEGNREQLKEGYTLGVGSITDNNAILTLYKGDKTIKHEKLYGDNPDKRRFVYMKKIGGNHHTILVVELDRVSLDATGGVAHLRGLSQFKDPEYVAITDSGDSAQGNESLPCDSSSNKWNVRLAESPYFRYLLSGCVFAAIFALILSVTRTRQKSR